MNAKIIIIGNEILSGFTKDLNAFFLIKNLLKKDVFVDNVVFIKDEISLGSVPLNGLNKTKSSFEIISPFEINLLE